MDVFLRKTQMCGNEQTKPRQSIGFTAAAEFCKPEKPAQRYIITKLLKSESAGTAEWRKLNFSTPCIVVKGNVIELFLKRNQIELDK